MLVECVISSKMAQFPMTRIILLRLSTCIRHCSKYPALHWFFTVPIKTKKEEKHVQRIALHQNVSYEYNLKKDGPVSNVHTGQMNISLQAWNLVVERARPFSFWKEHFHWRILKSIGNFRMGTKAKTRAMEVMLSCPLTRLSIYKPYL